MQTLKKINTPFFFKKAKVFNGQFIREMIKMAKKISEKISPTNNTVNAN